MVPRRRSPNVLAYQAVRDAGSAEDAKRIYQAVKVSPCYEGDACTLDERCPFYVDCMVAEGAGDG
jgi:hypothetical protein